MDRAFDAKLAAARAAFQAIRYRGPELDLSRAVATGDGFRRPFRWRPALAFTALLALLLALIPERPGPEPESPSFAPPALASPMDTLDVARRAIAAKPAAPPRPAEPIFRLPPPPRRPSRFAESSDSA